MGLFDKVKKQLRNAAETAKKAEAMEEKEAEKSEKPEAAEEKEADKPDKPEARNERVYAKYLVVNDIEDAFVCLFIKSEMYAHRVRQAVILYDEPYKSYCQRDKAGNEYDDMCSF